MSEAPLKRILSLVLSALLFASAPQALFAQFETASVLGYVRDSSGAFVSSATVTLVNTGTKSELTAQTDAQGAYQFTDVKVGQYQGLITYLVATAREKGVSAYVGDGLNRRPAAHVLDTARLYKLALEKREAGSRYHAVAEEGIPVRDIAEVIGRGLKVPGSQPVSGGGASSFRMARCVHGFRHASVKRANAGTAGLASNRPRPDRRSRTNALPLTLNRLRASSAFARWCAVASGETPASFVRCRSVRISRLL